MERLKLDLHQLIKALMSLDSFVMSEKEKKYKIFQICYFRIRCLPAEALCEGRSEAPWEDDKVRAFFRFFFLFI